MHVRARTLQNLFSSDTQQNYDKNKHFHSSFKNHSRVRRNSWHFLTWHVNGRLPSGSTMYLLFIFIQWDLELSHPNHGAVYMIRSYPWKADVKPQTVHKLNNQCYLWGVILNHTQLCVIYFTNYQASFVYLFCTKLTSALLINII